MHTRHGMTWHEIGCDDARSLIELMISYSNDRSIRLPSFFLSAVKGGYSKVARVLSLNGSTMREVRILCQSIAPFHMHACLIIQLIVLYHTSGVHPRQPQQRYHRHRVGSFHGSFLPHDSNC